MNEPRVDTWSRHADFKPIRERPVRRRSARLIAAAGLFLLVASSCSAAGHDAATNRAPSSEVVMVVVDDPADLEEGDWRLVDHLRTGHGHDVRLVAEDAALDLDSIALVVVSQSVGSDAFGVRHSDADVPMLVLDHGSWAELGLAEASGVSDVETHVEILDRGAPLRHGLAVGRHAALSHGHAMRYGTRVAEGGVPVVAAADASDQAIVFAFERGARLTNGSAPERRIAFGASVEAFDRFLAPAWDVFDASVSWLLDEPLARDGTALIVAGDDVTGLNASELALRSRLRRLGYSVDVVAAPELSPEAAATFDLVVMSKTVYSPDVGDRLKDVPTGVIFWEDNAQMLSMMATIDNDGEESTSWHSTRDGVYIDDEPEAPESLLRLRAGLSGEVPFYRELAEICWSPLQGGPSQLGGGALPVARLGGNGDAEHRRAIYAYEAGGELADGSSSVGRRVFFGLYDDTYRLLTREGVALFDAAVSWASGRSF